MKTLTVLYFAGVRDLTGTGEETLSVGDEVGSVRQLLQRLCQAHPRLEGRLETVRVARNETFVDSDEGVDDGDVLALIPPVQGG
jgi:molybdopterin synthase sulfur carrier subunit